MKPFRLLSATAIFLLLSATPSLAADQDVGIGFGLVDPEVIDSSFWIVANYRFSYSDYLKFEPEVGYWKKTVDAVRVQDTVFGFNVLYHRSLDQVNVFGGGGLGLHLLRGTLDTAGGRQADNDFKSGINLQGGVEYPFHDDWAAFAALRYDFVNDFNQFKFYGGVRYTNPLTPVDPYVIAALSCHPRAGGDPSFTGGNANCSNRGECRAIAARIAC